MHTRRTLVPLIITCGWLLSCSSSNGGGGGGGGQGGVGYITLDSMFLLAFGEVGEERYQRWVDLGCNALISWGNPDAQGFPKKGDSTWGDIPLDKHIQEFNAAAGKTVLYQIRDRLDGDFGRTDLLAWVQQDEPDGYGQLEAKLSQLQTVYTSYKQTDANRPVHLNFGGCDALTTSQPYAAAMAYGDWIDADVYPFTGYVHGSLTRGDITLVGKALDKLQDYLEQAGTPNKPLLAWIETVKVRGSTTGSAPSGAQVAAMMWNAILHGARGLVFWTLDDQDNFDATTEEVRAAIGKQAAIIHGLGATVLQGPINPQGVSGTVAAGLDVGWRTSGGSSYFIVQNTENNTKNNATIQLTGVTATSATVFEENHTAQISSGKITDNFEPYAVHIYVVQ